MNKQNKINQRELFKNLREFLQNGDDLQVIQRDVSSSSDTVDIHPKILDLQTVQRRYGNKIDRQLNIISQNIINSFLSLPGYKFAAVLQRMKLWGFRLVIQQFIINYYLYIKKDNRLKQFVMFHMQRLVRILSISLQKQLIQNIHNFSFQNRFTQQNLRKLKEQKKNNQVLISNIDIPDQLQVKQEQKQYQPGSQEAIALQQQLLDQLKSEHPKLQEQIL